MDKSITRVSCQQTLLCSSSHSSTVALIGSASKAVNTIKSAAYELGTKTATTIASPPCRQGDLNPTAICYPHELLNLRMYCAVSNLYREAPAFQLKYAEEAKTALVAQSTEGPIQFFLLMYMYNDKVARYITRVIYSRTPVDLVDTTRIVIPAEAPMSLKNASRSHVVDAVG